MRKPPIIPFQNDFLAEEVGRLFFNFLNSSISERPFDIFKQIELMFLTGSSTLFVDFEVLIRFSDELADVIEEQFTRVNFFICQSISEFVKKNFLRKIIVRRNDYYTKFGVGFFNFPNLNPIKFLRCKHIGRLTSIYGMIIGMTEPHLQLIQGIFECTNDNCKLKTFKVDQTYSFHQPNFCPVCGNSNSWDLRLEKSIFIETQKIRIQEIPEITQNKNVPQTLDIFIKEENISILKLGFKYIFTGFFTMVPKGSFFSSWENEKYQNKEPFCGSSSNVFSFSEHFFSSNFSASHVFCLEQTLQSECEKKKKKKKLLFSKKERDIIFRIRSQSNLYEFLKFFFLPNPLQENIRITLLLMLVGGFWKKKKNFFFGKNLNICLIGPPILGKCHFLRNLSYFFPRVFNLNGQFSHSSNLTGSILEETETNRLYIKTGTLLSASNGIFYIEGFEKLHMDDQISVLNTMENQCISYSIGGPNISFKTNVSVLASLDLNEKEKPTKERDHHVKKNFQTLILNKFDLIFFLRFQECRIESIKYPKSLFQFFKKEYKDYIGVSRKSIFQLYFSFARQLNPVITEENRCFLIDIYRFLREFPPINNSKKFFANIKHLESLIKLSEGFSKLFLCLKISKTHIKSASRLLFSSFFSLGFFWGNFFTKSNTLSFSEEHGGIGSRRKKDELYSSKKIKVSFYQFDKMNQNILKIIKNLEKKCYIGISFKNLIRILLKEERKNFKSKPNIGIKVLILCSINYLLSLKKLLKIKYKIQNEKKYFLKFLITYGW